MDMALEVGQTISVRFKKKSNSVTATLIRYDEEDDSWLCEWDEWSNGCRHRKTWEDASLLLKMP